MLTVTVYFRIKSNYLRQSMEFDTSENPSGLNNISSLPELLRESLILAFKVEDEDVQIISREEYEEETGEIEEE